MYSAEFLRSLRGLERCQQLPSGHTVPPPLLPGYKPEATPTRDGNWRDAAARDKQHSRKRDERKREQDTKDKEHVKAAAAKIMAASEKSWVHAQKNHAAAGDSEEQQDKVVVRTVNGILNKLTVEKFEPLYAQLLEAGIAKSEHIEALTKQLFAKATAQHHFISMYADICARLLEWLTENPVIPDAGKAFKRILLNQCQESFEEYLKPPAELEDLKGEELEVAYFRYKARMLGNMKFVGQLLMRKMVSSKVMFECAESLVEQRNEATLETLVVFLTTIGPHYDFEHFARYDQLQAVFAKVRELSTAKDLSPRTCILLKDLLALRASRWTKRGPKNEPEGPMKLSDVARGGSGAAPRRPAPKDDEWATVAMRKGGPARPALAPAQAKPAGAAAPKSAFLSLQEKSGAKKEKKEEKKEERPRKEDKREEPQKEERREVDVAACVKALANHVDTEECAQQLAGLAPAQVPRLIDSREPARRAGFRAIGSLGP